MALILTGTSALENLALHPVSSCRPRAFAQAFKSSVPSRAGVDAATHGELDGPQPAAPPTCAGRLVETHSCGSAVPRVGSAVATPGVLPARYRQ